MLMLDHWSSQGMALRKSELYSSLWSSRVAGCLPASNLDCVLVLLFIKYVSDKHAGRPFVPISIAPGASCKDMVALKGKSGCAAFVP